jgi:hypothetical protein
MLILGGFCCQCRFHCKKCGQLRFLLVRGCLPERMCECGSTSVSVPTWTKAGHGLTGGGLGRESFACPRCLRIYSSGSQLLKHNCCKKVMKSSLTLIIFYNTLQQIFFSTLLIYNVKI